MLGIWLVVALATQAAVVTLEGGTGWTLKRDGTAYWMKGAGRCHLDVASAAGATTFRTYSDSDLGDFLDDAEDEDLTVVAGIWLWPVNDNPSWWLDSSKRATKKTAISTTVAAHKAHDHLLMWAIGNEIFRGADLYSEAAEQAAIFLGEIADMIHVEDPDHPVTTCTASIKAELAWRLNSNASSLDLLCINAYGSDAENMPTKVTEAGWEKAYFLGESGPPGPWQVATTTWDAPYESTSTVKASCYGVQYDAQVADGNSVGMFVFRWGWKQGWTPSWLSIFNEYQYSGLTTDKEEGEANEIMKSKWSSTARVSYAPTVTSMSVDGKPQGYDLRRRPGTTMFATLNGVSDPNGDSLTCTWLVAHELEGLNENFETPQAPIAGLVTDNTTSCDNATVLVPIEESAYRLLVYIRDSTHHYATVNVPFLSTRTDFKVDVTEDTYVRGGKTNNYGDVSPIITKYSSNTNYVRKIYLKFAISLNGATITSAKLRMNLESGSGATTEVRDASTNWDEMTLHYNNQPSDAGTGVLDTISSIVVGTNEWDVTSYISQEASAGATSVAFVVSNTAQPDNSQRKWTAREEGDANPPQLIVTIS